VLRAGEGALVSRPMSALRIYVKSTLSGAISFIG